MSALQHSCAENLSFILKPQEASFLIHTFSNVYSRNGHGPLRYRRLFRRVAEYCRLVFIPILTSGEGSLFICLFYFFFFLQPLVDEKQSNFLLKVCIQCILLYMFTFMSTFFFLTVAERRAEPTVAQPRERAPSR